jgi:hypothetical protein
MEKDNDKIIAEMEEAALIAKKDLDIPRINASGDAVKEVANWMKRHYSKAGYKRLSRILLELAD